MKVLIANPPWFWERGHAVRAGSRWPHAEFDEEEERTNYAPFPFFMGYTAALLEKQGHNVKVIDALAEYCNKDLFLKRVEEFSPDFIIFETCTPSINNDLEIAKLIKEKTKAYIAFAGPHVSTFPEEIAKNEQVDFVFVGEYEFLAKEVIERLQKKKSLFGIKGVAYKLNKKVHYDGRAPLVSNIDELPFPARHLFNMNLYLEPFCKYKPNMQVVASRGCPYGCIYCLWPSVMYAGKTMRTRDPEKVCDECEEIAKKYDTKEIYIDDDTFNLNPKKVIDFCNAYIKRGINKPWSCMCHTNGMTKEILELMKKSGCEGIKFGVESGSQEILNKNRAGSTKEQIRKVFKWCEELGIRTHGTFVIGLPEETKETLKETFDFLIELIPDSYQLSVAMPYPGTKFYDIAKSENLLLAKKWEDFSNAHYIYEEPIIKTRNLSSKELKEASEYANNILPKKLLYKRLRKKPFIVFERMKCWYEDGGVPLVFKNMFGKTFRMFKAMTKSF